MKIAIIGAGLAGLGTAKFLLDAGASVTLFDAKGLRGGASSVCSGLLHPYPGIACRRSFKALEALQTTKELIRFAETNTHKPVSMQNGILRRALNPEQKERLFSHCVEYGDVEEMQEDLFLIHSGITVFTENYLEGLFNGLQKIGAELEIRKIKTLEELSAFDNIVIAAGYGIRDFPECRELKLKFLKGQALRVKGEPLFERSYISKGYVAHVGSSKEYELGSTYEREFTDDLPDVTKAKELLNPKGETVHCKAGVRVCNRTHYLPILERVSETTHVYTALGSRGLLYHGLFGKQLSHMILSKNKILS